MVATDPLSTAFAALADPTRRDILRRLRGGSKSVGDLAADYPISRPAVSQHLAVLERAGLVTRGRRARWNDCWLTTHSLDAAAGWIEQQREEWVERLDRLGDHLTVPRSVAGSVNDDKGTAL